MINTMINTIICSDCLPILKGLPDKSVDCVITDPPYGIDFQSARRTDRSQWKPKIANDERPFTEWLPDAYRVLKTGGRLICFCRWDVQDEFKLSIAQSGFEVKSQLVWDKVVHGMGDLQGEFAPQHEVMWYATKGRYVFLNKRPKTILRYQRVSPEALLHPNEKPVDLLKDLILSLSLSSDIVLDCFAGSGTTCVAAELLGRKWIGIELDPNYCDIARRRVKEAKEQFALLELNK